MAGGTPEYVIRGKLLQGTDKDTLVTFMAQVMSAVLGASMVAETPIIEGRPRQEWWSRDWARLRDDDRMGDEIAGLLRQEDPQELLRVFNFALTTAANNTIALNQLDFISSLGAVLVNVLATEGSIEEYIGS